MDADIRNLIHSLLQKNKNKRLTIDQILEHPAVKKYSSTLVGPLPEKDKKILARNFILNAANDKNRVFPKFVVEFQRGGLLRINFPGNNIISQGEPLVSNIISKGEQHANDFIPPKVIPIPELKIETQKFPVQPPQITSRTFLYQNYNDSGASRIPAQIDYSRIDQSQRSTSASKVVYQVISPSNNNVVANLGHIRNHSVEQSPQAYNFYKVGISNTMPTSKIRDNQDSIRNTTFLPKTNTLFLDAQPKTSNPVNYHKEMDHHQYNIYSNFSPNPKKEFARNPIVYSANNSRMDLGNTDSFKSQYQVNRGPSPAFKTDLYVKSDLDQSNIYLSDLGRPNSIEMTKGTLTSTGTATPNHLKYQKYSPAELSKTEIQRNGPNSAFIDIVLGNSISSFAKLEQQKTLRDQVFKTRPYDR